MPTKTKGRAATSSGLSIKTFKGLNETRMQKGSFNRGIRVQLKDNDIIPIQFTCDPDEFVEYSVHVWRDGNWNFVPCLGDSCPLCADEDDGRRKTSYQFATVVYNLKEKKYQILVGPKDLAGRILNRFQRAPGRWNKRTYEISRYPTTPVSYEFAVGEEDMVRVDAKKVAELDIDKYLEDEAKRFYGDELPSATSAMDEGDEDDDLEEDDDEVEEYTVKDLKAMRVGKLREVAEALGVDTDGLSKTDIVNGIIEAQEESEDAEDEDEEEEDEDFEDEEELDDEDEDEEDEDLDEDEEEDEDFDDEEEEEEPVKPARSRKAAPARRTGAATKTATKPTTRKATAKTATPPARKAAPARRPARRR